MNIILFLFLAATLISQSAMDFFSAIILIFCLIFFFKKESQLSFNLKKSLSRLNPLISHFSFDIYFSIWIFLIFIGLILNTDSLIAIKSTGEWKWVINFYSLFWFFQMVMTQNPISVSSNNSLHFKSDSDQEKNMAVDLFKPLMNLKPLWWLLLACFFYGGLSLVLGKNLIDSSPLTHGTRFAGPFDDPMNFAHIYGMYFCFTFGILISLFDFYFSKNSFSNTLNKIIKNHFLFVSASILTALSVLLSLTRGAWIGVGLSAIIITCIFNKKWGLFLAGLLCSGFIFLFLGWHSFQKRVLQAFSPTESYDNERIVLWKANWAIFKDHPLFGIGYGQYKQILPEYFKQMSLPLDQFQSHAHNQYLQFLSNTGIVGFILYIGFIFILMYLTYRIYKLSKSPIVLGSLAAQIAFHIGSFTECNFERAKVRLVFLIFATLPLSYYFAKLQTKKETV